MLQCTAMHMLGCRLLTAAVMSLYLPTCDQNLFSLLGPKGLFVEDRNMKTPLHITLSQGLWGGGAA